MIFLLLMVFGVLFLFAFPTNTYFLVVLKMVVKYTSLLLQLENSSCFHLRIIETCINGRILAVICIMTSS